MRGGLDGGPVTASDGDVAHLAAGAGFALAIEVKVHPGQGQGAGPVRRAVLPQIPEQVEQDGDAPRYHQQLDGFRAKERDRVLALTLEEPA